MTTITLRTRYLKATDTLGSRIRVERVEDGIARRPRTMPLNYAAGNHHDAAALQYLQESGLISFGLYRERDSRSGMGNIYRVEVR